MNFVNVKHIKLKLKILINFKRNFLRKVAMCFKTYTSISNIFVNVLQDRKTDI